MPAEPPPPGAAVPPGGPPPPAPPYQPAPPYPTAPYRQPPYQQPPYQSPPPRPPQDGLAIAGFVISIIGGVLIGVILCLVALSRIRRSGARGRGFAIAGLAISGAWVVLIGGLAATGLLTEPDETTTGQVSSQSLRPGVCLTDVPDGEIFRVRAVACTSPHKALVAAAFDLPDGAYPGDDAVASAANDGCLSRLPAELQSRQDLEIHYLHPQRRGWILGDHEVTCLVSAASGDLTEDLATLVPGLGT